ncbi:type II toxin-antitoxin system ParD family antitoxin [Teichococcus vastitatis]|jgi:antitoxin ParD1/3/4|uniref:Type II toxin-antitoxin system ParD family antitoxin n=2 Tax=Teichococcus vastitatis TaxID=2307076 RepID=A0ABS9W5X5_9PROT|nr:type II toxin-antitoxin system ParD family antitoxin [Pseudoroseomonas vastitatis]MCI0754315.1 type II toxin-antitoxin system ParD family antitoxin [Pseudoroseomonas vastitatis]
MTRQICKNVSITPAMDRFIAERIASGRYQNASEVVRAALRVLEREEAIEQERFLRLAACSSETER